MEDNTLLNFAANQEKRVDNVLEKVVVSHSMTQKARKILKLVGNRPSVMYGFLNCFHKLFSVVANYRLSFRVKRFSF